MSSLTYIEKSKFEKLFRMSGGYVCDFSNATFGHFCADEVGIDIHSEKYGGEGISKANKLRKFWEIESDYLVGKLSMALTIHENDKFSGFGSDNAEKEQLVNSCKIIAARLMSGKVNLDDLKTTADVFDAKHLSEQIRRIEQSINTDPALAIGTAKELIETCCKTILAERGKSVVGSPDIPVLTKDVLRELELVPEGIHDSAKGKDVIKRLLQNLGTIGNNLAELRGLYGTGHGKHGRAEGLSTRHARLAVGAASTLVMFLFETHKEKPVKREAA